MLDDSFCTDMYTVKAKHFVNNFNFSDLYVAYTHNYSLKTNIECEKQFIKETVFTIYTIQIQ